MNWKFWTWFKKEFEPIELSLIAETKSVIQAMVEHKPLHNVHIDIYVFANKAIHHYESKGGKFDIDIVDTQVVHLPVDYDKLFDEYMIECRGGMCESCKRLRKNKLK